MQVKESLKQELDFGNSSDEEGSKLSNVDENDDRLVFDYNFS